MNCRAEQFLLPRIGSGNIRFELVRRLYDLIGNHGCKKVFGNQDFISLVDIGQEMLPHPLHVDEAHFSPKFNEYIAKKISAHLVFSHRDLARKRGKILSREIKGTLDEVVNPHNYPLFYFVNQRCAHQARYFNECKTLRLLRMRQLCL